MLLPAIPNMYQRLFKMSMTMSPCCHNLNSVETDCMGKKYYHIFSCCITTLYNNLCSSVLPLFSCQIILKPQVPIQILIKIDLVDNVTGIHSDDNATVIHSDDKP